MAADPRPDRAAAPEDFCLLDIYLRGGQTITVPVIDWKIDYGKEDGEITCFRWEHPNTAHRIAQLDLSEIVAVIRRPAAAVSGEPAE